MSKVLQFEEEKKNESSVYFSDLKKKSMHINNGTEKQVEKLHFLNILQ